MHNLMLVLAFITISFNFLKCATEEVSSNAEVNVNITQGTLKGKSLNTEAGVPYFSFQGIPYAEAPVGKLRFKAPQTPAPSWEGVRDATKEGGICPQVMLFNLTVYLGVEDCLYLNVYTTQLPSENENLNLPVMVWIHGGAFSFGSGNTDWYGPDFLINNKDIVIVTINYRLGVLGFLGLNHSDISKNNGMKDQVAALQWVRDNIHKFGGNPNDVTIFGESAGGASVEFLLLSPKSEGLFHKAISQSGSVLTYWAYTDPSDAHKRALDVGKELSYNTNDISALLDSLMAAEPYDLVRAGNTIHAPLSLATVETTILFTPTIEDDSETAFLIDKPINLVKAGNFHKVPFITGATSAEGKIFATALYKNSSLWSFIDENFEEVAVPQELGHKNGSPESLKLAKDIKETYFGNESLSEDSLTQYIKFQGDYGFISGMYRNIKHHLATSNSTVYFYIFSYEGNQSLSAILNLNYTKGASHGDEVGYLFKMNAFNFNVEKNSTETEISKYITKLWTNFAKTGVPSAGSGVTWDPVTKENFKYLNIDAEPSMQDFKNFEPEEMALWTEIYQSVDSL